MTDPAPHPELLASLGRMVRGLSALFWGLPLALVVCVQTAKDEWLRPLNILPPLIATSLLFYGITLFGRFQKQERIWINALERAKLFALVNVGLSPFIYWWSRLPGNFLYSAMVQLLMISGLLFLFSLNPVLWRLAAMLPDETLRHETRFFTRINCTLLGIMLWLKILFLVLRRVTELPEPVSKILYYMEEADTGRWLMLLLVLLPIAMTMALIWKTKEVILSSVFGPES